MKISSICESSSLVINYADSEDWETAEEAGNIADVSGIRISRNKELSLVAYYNDSLVGAVWSCFDIDHEASDEYGSDVYRFDFDIAVDPKFRGAILAGPKLIDRALNYYRELRSDVDNAYIRVHVVNPKLAAFLENNYNFETEGGMWHRSQPHMTYHGD